jgi:hypothetical protein
MAAAGQKRKNESPPSQPIPADSTVGKFKTVATCKSFQTKMTGDPTETIQQKWTKTKMAKVLNLSLASLL